ncbi:S41 family peptidase [uncultured Croceitalea sp.]|uniref:S41 family peptidase n=1 Tax=uncultured Croceitalea sp. TaxID=1798908 RepID=UPI0033064382
MKNLYLFAIIILTCSCNTKPREVVDPNLTKELSVVTDSIIQLISNYHYNPNELESSEYIDLKEQMLSLAKNSNSKDDFIDKFNLVWQDGPFSHVRLGKLDRKAEDMADFIDSLIIGEQGVSLDFNGETAILSVNTMTGMDTKERISEAYTKIQDNNSNILIIDLRNNNGGTFAGVPLVGHLLNDSIDAGVFVSRKWWENNERAPSQLDIKKLSPWFEWSIKSFWEDTQEQPLTRIKFGPFQPHFNGKVYVLISNKTVSAAEFTVDALSQNEKVTIIGETTAGEMLSQKLYDLPHGYQLGLPIADYYSLQNGRLEGKGVNPNIRVNQALAMDLATSLINGDSKEVAMAKMEVEMEKLNDTPLKGETLYLMGSMNDWGQSLKNTPQFTYKGDGIYESTITLKSGKHEFKIAPLGWKFDYGANSKKEILKIGSKTTLLRQSGSSNLILNVKNESELVFSLEVKNPMDAELSVLRK